MQARSRLPVEPDIAGRGHARYTLHARAFLFQGYNPKGRARPAKFMVAILRCPRVPIYTLTEIIPTGCQSARDLDP
jgi:hypothetical protein